MNRGAAQISGGVVLVVDDDATIRMLARETLEPAGFAVTEVGDGSLALAAFEQERPDIILLDVMMPGTDGFTVCRQIREHPDGKNVPIVMMTGLDDAESMKLAYETGATDFITKPVNWLILGQRVRYLQRAGRVLCDLIKNQTRLSYAQQIARMGSWEWDVENDKMRWSDEIYRLFNIDPIGFDGNYHAFLNSVHPLDKEFFNSALEEALASNKPYSLDHQILLPDGTERFVHTEAEVVADKDGRPVLVTGTVQDITERKQTEERIRYLAYYDSLTSLPNRILFKDHLERAINYAERHQRKIAALFLDLDRFKYINDTLGHSVGDKLLQKVAERLGQCVRKYDQLSRDPNEPFTVIARLGGDEFTILLDDIGHAQDAAKVAQRIIETTAKPFELEGHEVFVTVSIGISVYPNDGRDLNALIKNADTAMYHAKELGRNNFQFYTEVMNATAFERMKLENQLRKALERDEFMLHYQPQVDTRSGRIIGLEALIRWHNAELGMISPADFIPLAEETGLIICIDDWVITTACKQLKLWEEAGLPPVRVAINLSGQHFRQKNLVQTVRQIVDDTGINPNCLELELTEGVLMSKAMETITTLNELKAMGLSLSVDDFGTGYSSLSYLTRFPLDVLKIDQSFVANVTDDPDNAAIITAIIAMARSLKLEIIAEGVETVEQMTFLRAHGCHEMQGYLFGRPLPAEAATLLLREGIGAISAPNKGSRPADDGEQGGADAPFSGPFILRQAEEPPVMQLLPA